MLEMSEPEFDAQHIRSVVSHQLARMTLLRGQVRALIETADRMTAALAQESRARRERGNLPEGEQGTGAMATEG